MEIGYTLQTPCSDCPFKKSTPLHPGVMKALPEYDKKLREGWWGHSCHKTDSRSDGFDDKYKGELQHCAGALILMKKIDEADLPDYKPQDGLVRAMIHGLDYNEIPDDPDVFSSMAEMLEAYREMTELDQLKIHIRTR